MFKIYQNSIAITQFYHHPDIFETMTANPKWPEIINKLLPNQMSSDCSDL
ncbi:30658_t:CDS:1, partial [Racocetra persica]